MHLGLLLKGRICFLGEQILSFKSNPQIWSDTVNTIKVVICGKYKNLNKITKI